jgi:uncharacterized protein (DUF1697 family)
VKYLALLRGINVGGNNIIRMKDLKEVVEINGFHNVVTYIQSGNVIFDSEENDKKIITKKLEKLLSKAFNYQASLVLLSKNELQTVLKKVPESWKKQQDLRCYLAFIKEPTTAEQVVPFIHPKDEVDAVETGKGIIYMSTKLSGLTKSGFTKLIGTKIYKELTMRNYNTTKKLLELME